MPPLAAAAEGGGAPLSGRGAGIAPETVAG